MNRNESVWTGLNRSRGWLIGYFCGIVILTFKNMKRAILIGVIAAVGCASMSADINKGIIRYDSRLPKAEGEYRYSHEQLLKWGKNPRPDAQWRLIRRTESDTKGCRQLKNDSIDAYRNRSEKCLELGGYAYKMALRAGSKMKGQTDIDIINKILSSPELLNAGQNKSEKDLQKDREKIQKDLAKGKICGKLRKPLEYYSSRLVELSEAYSKEADDMQKDWAGFYRDRGRQDPLSAMANYVDTVSNPFYYDNIYLSLRDGSINYSDVEETLKSILMNAPLKGWEWTENDDYEEFDQSYPVSVTYRKYASHPEYRIIGDLAFDTEGNLVRLINLDSEKYWNIDIFSNDNPVGRQLLRIAYNDNEYNIQSKGQKVNHYIKTQLGLEDLTKAEKAQQDKSADAIAKALIGSARDERRYGRHSRRGRAAQNKHALAFLGALVGAADNHYSEDGAAWIRQIQEDNLQYFSDQYPYRLERLSDTAIRVVLADEEASPTYAVTFSYTPAGPYRVKEEITLEKLFGE